jgi:phasin family protein
MHSSVKEFLEEQTQGLAELAENLRKSRIAAARRAATMSAARVRSLNTRVRELARSGVRLTSISHGTVQSLIELQGEIVTSAITDAAAQIQRLAETESVRDLARQQAEVLQATRQRIVDDITRAVTILRGAAADARKATVRAGAAEAAAPKKKARAKAKRKAAKTVRKTVRKTARKAARKTNRRAKR